MKTARALRLRKHLDSIGQIHARNDLNSKQRRRRLSDLKIKARKEAENDRQQPLLKYRAKKSSNNWLPVPQKDFPLTAHDTPLTPAVSDDESIDNAETENSKIQEMRIKSLVRRCSQLELDAIYWKQKFGKESAYRIESSRLRSQIQALKDKLSIRKKVSSSAIQDMHLDRKRAALVRRARDLEGEKVLLHLQIAELTREKEASTKNQDSLQQRLKTMREKMVHYKSMYYKQLRSQANLITQSEWLELSDESKADMMEATKDVGFAPKWRDKDNDKKKGYGIGRNSSAKRRLKDETT